VRSASSTRPRRRPLTTTEFWRRIRRLAGPSNPRARPAAAARSRGVGALLAVLSGIAAIIRIWPVVGWRAPTIVLTSVDLPAPLGPAWLLTRRLKLDVQGFRAGPYGHFLEPYGGGLRSLPAGPGNRRCTELPSIGARLNEVARLQAQAAIRWPLTNVLERDRQSMSQKSSLAGPAGAPGLASAPTPDCRASTQCWISNSNATNQDPASRPMTPPCRMTDLWRGAIDLLSEVAARHP